jgi:hypothetical protein
LEFGPPEKWLNLSDAPFLSLLGISEFQEFYIGDRFPEFGREGVVKNI